MKCQQSSPASFPSSFFLFPPHSFWYTFSCYSYQNLAMASASASASAQAPAARPRANGSGSRISFPPSLQRAHHTPAGPSTVAVRPNSSVTMPSRLPVRSVAPVRAPNVSSLLLAVAPVHLNATSFVLLWCGEPTAFITSDQAKLVSTHCTSQPDSCRVPASKMSIIRTGISSYNLLHCHPPRYSCRYFSVYHYSAGSYSHAHALHVLKHLEPSN